MGGIIAKRYGLETQGANMGKIHRTDRDPTPVDESLTEKDTYVVFAGFPGADKVTFVPYFAQSGLQAITSGYLADWFGLSRIEQIQIIPAMLMALVISLLFAAYLKIYDPLFAVLFLRRLVFALYVLSMARNRYWSPFLLFLPALLATVLYRDTSARRYAARPAGNNPYRGYRTPDLWRPYSLWRGRDKAIT